MSFRVSGKISRNRLAGCS